MKRASIGKSQWPSRSVPAVQDLWESLNMFCLGVNYIMICILSKSIPLKDYLAPSDYQIKNILLADSYSKISHDCARLLAVAKKIKKKKLSARLHL